MKSSACEIHSFYSILVVTLLLVGCRDEIVNNSDQIVGSGRLETRDVSLPTFSSIDLTGIGEVFVTQDPVQSVRLEADDNIIDRLLVEVRNGNLSIGIQHGSYSHVTVKIYVSMNSVQFLQVTGAGNFAAVGPLEANALTCRIVGAGSMTLSGSAASQIIEIGGTGSVHSFDLETSHCSVMLSGTGSAEVNVIQHLEATVTGVGSVTYAGNPPEVVTHVSGLGTIRRK